jgi:selenide,water dikinase
VPQREDIISGLHTPDDAAVLSVPAGKLMVQTVDSFPAMISDPYLFGKISANHCLSDIFAMGAEPRSAMAIAALPLAMPEKTQADLFEMMSGAAEVLHAAGCALAGGHTAEGPQLSLGFAITGWITPDLLTEKTSLGPGQTLILTKPIGTGVIFAAGMRAKARGRWLEQAIQAACQSNQRAAGILRNNGARAVTDITGFGLIGHLTEMLRPGHTRADIVLGRIPILPGAQELSLSGIASSLLGANLEVGRNIANAAAAAQNPKYPLLYDPQTAGGLLAGVPSESADACIQQLHPAGYTRAAIIGSTMENITPERPPIQLC